MPQFQNYYPNQMPQFQQPFNPMANAQQRLAQMEQQYPQFAQQNYMQQPQQIPGANAQPQGINGKYVNSPDEVTASDVLMDGTVSLFPKNDLSEIYGKAWQPDGTIKTVVFKPVSEETPTNTYENNKITENKAFLTFKDEIAGMFDGINKRFDKLEKALKPTEAKSKTAKTKSE